MVPLLLLPLLWGGSLQEKRGYEYGVQHLVRVQEGLCVLMPCSFSCPWSSRPSSGKLYTSWYRRRSNTGYADLVATNNPNKEVEWETKRRFLLADSRTNNCSLSIRDARKTDAGTYFFHEEKGYNVEYTYQHKKLTLQVTELTQKPDILIQEPLVSGRPTQLTCNLPGSCEGGRPLTFSWVGAALDSLNDQNLRSSVLTFTPRPQDHGTNLTCQVKLQGSGLTTQRTVWLNVFYAPQNLIIGMSFRNVTGLRIVQDTSLPTLEGEALRLLCVADSNPPAQLSWFRGSPDLNTAPISSTAILELPRVGTGEEGQFTCQALHPLGSRSLSLNLSVVYPPQLLGPSCSWEDEGLRCSCSSRAQPAPSLRWRLGEGLLERNHSNISYMVTSSSNGCWANSSLNLLAELSAGLRLSCEAENVHGAQSASVLLLPGKPELGKAFFLGAVGGAGVAGLVSLCLCFIFFKVKTRRKDVPEAAAGGKDAPSLLGPTPWGYQFKSPPGSRRDHPAPAPAAPTSGEELELHYASLSFQGLRPWERPDQEATSSTEYAEIKIRE